VPVRWKDGIEDVPDPAVVDHKRESLQELHPSGLEGREAELSGQLQPLVAQHGERQMEALRHLALVGAVLGAEREDANAKLGELRMRVAKAAGLRRAAAGAGDRVPTGRQLLVGATGAGVAEEDGPAGQLADRDGLPGRGR
jgi:hypothetical protein